MATQALIPRSETSGSPPARLRFGVFELDLRTGELRKDGLAVRLRPQAFKLLAMLATRPGELVTREEIREELWGGGTFVGFEQGINFCINQIRVALGDEAATPRYVQTLARRGYRFVAAVEAVRVRPEPGVPAEASPRRRALAAAVLLLATIVLAALQPGTSAPAPIGRIRIAVLPFVDLAADPYLGDGLTEELITQLGALQPERLGVVARTSVMRYKESPRDPASIGRELRVDYLLEGSVRQSAQRVRVSAKLITTRDATQVWARVYEREVRDVLELQAELARDIAAGVRVALPPSARPAPPVDAQAYELYLRGRYVLGKRREPDVLKAIGLFERAAARDPRSALPQVGLAEAYAVLGDYGMAPPGEAFPRMKAAALRALELDPQSGPAHAALGNVLDAYEWKFAEAEAALRRAIAANPSHADAHHLLGRLLRVLGRTEEALLEARTALELDPLSLAVGHNLALALLAHGDVAAAREQVRRNLELDPGFAPAHYGDGSVLLAERRYQAAATAYRRAMELGPEVALYRCSAAYALALAGRTAEAREALRELIELSTRGYVSPTGIAAVHAALGEAEAAMAWLQKALAIRDPVLVRHLAAGRFAALERDARFARLALPVPAPRGAAVAATPINSVVSPLTPR